MHKNIKILGVVAAAGVVAAGGSAFTNSNTGNGTLTQVGGYNSATVTGVIVDDVDYIYSADRATLDSVTYALDASNTLVTDAVTEVSHDNGVTWTTCETRLAVTAPIVCNVNVATTSVISMNLVVRAVDSTTTPAV